jgi:hydroxyacyl-ACP dehydratase HTD2-like protein with hotdog domain
VVQCNLEVLLYFHLELQEAFTARRNAAKQGSSQFIAPGGLFGVAYDIHLFSAPKLHWKLDYVENVMGLMMMCPLAQIRVEVLRCDMEFRFRANSELVARTWHSYQTPLSRPLSQRNS